MPILAAILTFISIFLIIAGLAQMLANEQPISARRMTQSGVGIKRGVLIADPLEEEKFPAIFGFLEHLGYMEGLRNALARAALPIRPTEYVVIVGLCVVVPAWCALILGAGPLIIAALAVAGYLIPKIYLTVRENIRKNKIEAQLADALTLISGAVRSGYSFLRSAQLVADEMPAPISEEFEKIVRQTNLGISTEEALHRLMQRVPSYDLDLVVTAVLIQMQGGGNLAEILENISGTIRERAAIRGEIKVQTSEARLSMVVLAVLPFVMVGLLSLVNPHYIGILLKSDLGHILLIMAALMQVVGIFLMRKMIQLDI